MAIQADPISVKHFMYEGAKAGAFVGTGIGTLLCGSIGMLMPMFALMSNKPIMNPYAFFIVGTSCGAAAGTAIGTVLGGTVALVCKVASKYPALWSTKQSEQLTNYGTRKITTTNYFLHFFPTSTTDREIMPERKSCVIL